MLANIRDITEEIRTLLEFNRGVLANVELQDLHDMKQKLEAILVIKRYMAEIDKIKLTKDLEVLADKYSDIIREGAEIAQADRKSRLESSVSAAMTQPRSYASSSGYYEPPSEDSQALLFSNGIKRPDTGIAFDISGLPTKDNTPIASVSGTSGDRTPLSVCKENFIQKSKTLNNKNAHSRAKSQG